jgi:RNA polymerase sigma-70 factor (ECF subfamily)
MAPLGRPAVVDGRPGAVVAAGDRVLAVVAFTVEGDRVTEMDLLVDPDRLRHVRI